MFPNHTMFPNLSNTELFRMNGTLPSERIEGLLDVEAVDFEGARSHIEEARGQFPEEDALSDVLKELRAVAKAMRESGNKTRLESAIEALEEVEGRIQADTEYGRDELQNALGILYI